MSRMSTTGSFPCHSLPLGSLSASQDCSPAMGQLGSFGGPLLQPTPHMQLNQSNAYDDALKGLLGVGFLSPAELFAEQPAGAAAEDMPQLLLRHATAPPAPSARCVPGEEILQQVIYQPDELLAEEPTPAAIPASGAGSGWASRQKAEVHCNVYYLRPVTFNEHNRVSTMLSENDYKWQLHKLKEDSIGRYHVGVVVRDREYVFGNYRAPNSVLHGGEESGICAHDPQKAGPQYVFKQAESLGHTALTVEQIDRIADDLGNDAFKRNTYVKLDHNCVDFAKVFCQRLSVQEPPPWCSWAADTARAAKAKGQWFNEVIAGPLAAAAMAEEDAEAAAYLPKVGIEGVETAPSDNRFFGMMPSGGPLRATGIEGIDTAPSSGGGRRFAVGMSPPRQPEGIGTAPIASRQSTLSPGGLPPPRQLEELSPSGFVAPPGPQGPISAPPRTPIRASSVDGPRPLRRQLGSRPQIPSRHPVSVVPVKNNPVPVRVEVVCSHSRQSSCATAAEVAS